ncbi:hypothetical protein ANANG_G00101280 [Anguilla anguilla]|uniref:Uncharacterized protein n=1 Tax=Anguilla anguilla TaxID=7936 RepID=A0A9D3RZ67_ANGAN|nr:hypothetical protein ANANG_G00101280 [Anguilla anguilla]
MVTIEPQYQEEAACTLEYIQRSFLGINPKKGSKSCQGKMVSKKTGQVVQKKSTSVNPHVCTLLRRLTEFEWDFV